MPRIIYVLTNEAMPGLVKIGLTSDSVESRIANLSASTGVPLPFECHFAAEIPEGVNLEKIEKTLHQLFAEHRINPRREFFKVEPEKVVLALSIGSFKEVTPGRAPTLTPSRSKPWKRSRNSAAHASIWRHWASRWAMNWCCLATKTSKPLC